MTNPWTFEAAPSTSGLAQPTVTLVDGDSFCISEVSGDIRPGTAQGLFDRDTRFVSRWELLLNDEAPEHLEVLPETPFGARLLARARPAPGRADSTLLVIRHRHVGRGMREEVVLRNLADEPAAARLAFLVDADFAHIFEVKEERVVQRGERRVDTAGGTLHFEHAWRGVRRGLVVTVHGAEATVFDGVVSVAAVVPARGEWRACVQATPLVDGVAEHPRHPCGQPVETAAPLRRLQRWRRAVPRIRSGNEDLDLCVKVSEEDLGALRIFDPDFPERAVVAAGVPWFMTLFGRDALLTSWMALLVDPDLALGTLQTLARYQGTTYDPLSEEEPGRIPHELRWGSVRSLGRGEAGLYYGTVDATPLFVMLLGELRRWGLAPELVDELLPHADRALEWLATDGDRDGDGLVEYRRATDQGLANQGWKDSFDGISFADGRLPEAPVALCEVQGYAYAAYLARAELAADRGDREGQRRFENEAARLKARFNDAFWLPEEGTFAVGLDREKRPIDSVTSNVGHCLWTGIVDEAKAPAVVARLVAEDMFTGFGLRTLSSAMRAYNPVSYHNGSVWPHDNAIAVAGLLRYGFTAEAEKVVLGLLDAAASFMGRLPELFCGFDRAEFATPVRYPSACSPQAWATAAPYLVVRALLGFDPSVQRGVVRIAPAVVDRIGDLDLEHIPLGGSRVAVRVHQGAVEVDGLPPGVTLEAPSPVPAERRGP